MSVVRASSARLTTNHGKPIDKGFLHKLLNNPIYAGEAVYKATAYPGEHETIISHDLWDKTRAVIEVSPHLLAAYA